MIGSATAKPKYAASQSVVVNASTGPIVISLWRRSGGSGRSSHLDQVRVDREAGDRSDHNRPDHEEEPLAQLFEMLDERRLFTVLKATRSPKPGTLAI